MTATGNLSFTTTMSVTATFSPTNVNLSNFTVLAMAVCIFLICTLRTFVAAVDQNLRTSNASRLVTRHAVSLVFNVPVSYEERIAWRRD